MSDRSEEGWGGRGGGHGCRAAFPAEGGAGAVVFTELLAVVEEFAAEFGCRGLLQLLKEGGGEGGRGETGLGKEFVEVGLSFGVEGAGLEGGDLFAEVVALESSGEELLFEAGDLG